MATRSRIAIENENGKVQSIYCHYDGYPSHNGEILNGNYVDVDTVKELIGLGDISILAENVTETQAYGRDRGESGTEAMEHSNRNEFKSIEYGEYAYLFNTKGQWEVLGVEADYTNLTEVL